MPSLSRCPPRLPDLPAGSSLPSTQASSEPGMALSSLLLPHRTGGLGDPSGPTGRGGQEASDSHSLLHLKSTPPGRIYLPNKYTEGGRRVGQLDDPPEVRWVIPGQSQPRPCATCHPSSEDKGYLHACEALRTSLACPEPRVGQGAICCVTKLMKGGGSVWSSHSFPPSLHSSFRPSLWHL